MLSKFSLDRNLVYGDNSSFTNLQAATVRRRPGGEAGLDPASLAAREAGAWRSISVPGTGGTAGDTMADVRAGLRPVDVHGDPAR